MRIPRTARALARPSRAASTSSPTRSPRRSAERGIALVPTLKLWPYEGGKFKMPAALIDRLVGNGETQLREFAALGGQVLFGTDVGYMTDHDPTDEYVYMQHAGLSAAQILASLT